MSSRSSSTALALRRSAQVTTVGSNRIECHERGRRFLCQLRHARRCGMQPHLQCVEIETASCRDHNLAVEDTAVRQFG